MRRAFRDLAIGVGVIAVVAVFMVAPLWMFDIVAIAMGSAALWWMWTRPPAVIRDTGGWFPWASIVFVGAGALVGGVVARTIGRPGFHIAQLLLVIAVLAGVLRGATASHGRDS